MWNLALKDTQGALRRRLSLWLLPPLLLHGAHAWNSFGSVSQVYSFQEFYTDAQYGPDFGYYSTGAILHGDGPADNGLGIDGGAQNWFNSYTTLPMSLSPDFGDTLCDRLVTMWQSMGRPTRVVLVEFGGGTGMLARDILRRSRDWHDDFYAAVQRYVIAERSEALRAAQRHTAAEFVAAGKLEVVEADARHASLVRPVLEEAMGASGEAANETVGFVLSNELLDEFDPVRLRLVWHAGEPPSKQQCTQCGSYREAYVIHRVDLSAAEALFKRDAPDGEGAIDSGVAVEEAASTIEELRWEGDSLHCGLLTTPAVQNAMLFVHKYLEPAERAACAPLLVCCCPFLVAVNQALMFDAKALDPAHVVRNDTVDGTPVLLRNYRHHLHRINGSVPLSKDRYRQLRRLAAQRGPEVERALLVGGAPSILPGRMHSEEVFLALQPARCRELRGWMRRHSERLAVASRLRNGVAFLFDGDGEHGRTSMHIKLVLRPGEAEFVDEAAKLLDEGFLVTLDYGADANALAWQALVRPNYEGIHIMDARWDTHKDCTAVSYLECPGLQDLTTSVDFTEVAEAGRERGGWDVRAYGPIFLLELSFLQGTKLNLVAPGAPRGEPMRLGHLVERAYGVRTSGLTAWYQKPEHDPWASFKLLVQHRGTRGAGWTLGALSGEWPLSDHGSTRLGHSPSSCWRQDITKPPLASFIAAAAQSALSDDTAVNADAAAVVSDTDATALWPNETGTQLTVVESPKVHAALLQHFQALLMKGGEGVAELLDAQHVAQQQAYADTHLALLLVDYWHLIEAVAGREHNGSEELDSRLDEIGSIGWSRRLPEIYGEEAFARVLRDVVDVIRNKTQLPQRPTSTEPYACLAGSALPDVMRYSLAANA